MKRGIHIDQFCAGFARGDAISHEALVLRQYLRGLGFSSEIYSEHFSESDAALVRHFKHYKDRAKSVLIYHHSFYSDFLRILPTLKARKILIYHNTTPTHFVRPYNPQMANQLERTRGRLAEFVELFELHLADSRENARALRAIGFDDIKILPVPLQPLEVSLSEGNWQPSFLEDGKKNILFVGRIFPNKRHQDLIKAYYFYKKLEPHSRLILVGDFNPGMKSYTAELLNLSRALGVERNVLFTGMVASRMLNFIYNKADLFLSMSEHEGFFVPLVESMKMELPIMAYASSVVPETLGNSGVLFYKKDYPKVACMMQEILSNYKLRSSLIAAQKRRLSAFSLKSTLESFRNALLEIGLLG